MKYNRYSKCCINPVLEMHARKKLPANFNFDACEPHEADIKRADDMTWSGRSFYGSNAPYLYKVRKAGLCADPVKQVRLAKAVCRRFNSLGPRVYENWKEDEKGTRISTFFCPSKMMWESLLEIGVPDTKARQITEYWQDLG
jgi:hypothetical protein